MVTELLPQFLLAYSKSPLKKKKKKKIRKKLKHERIYLQKLEAIRTNSIIKSKSSTYSPLHI